MTALTLKRPHGYANYRILPLLLAACLAAVLGGCETSPPRDTSREPAKIETPPDPIPAKAEQPVNYDALTRITNLAIEEGTVAARTERNALLVRGLDATSLTLIDSELAWLEGDLKLADKLLNQVKMTDDAGRQFILKLRQQRAEMNRDFLGAAKIAHQRYNLAAAGEQSALADELFGILMRFTDGQLRSQGFRSDDSDWNGWVSMMRAYRDGRTAYRNWARKFPEHPAAVNPPAGLAYWLKQTAPAKIAVMLPLSGSLQAAGEAVLDGIVETLYGMFPTPAERPTLSVIDTDQFKTILDAYREAINADADLAIGPLTKRQAYELGNLKSRPVPVLALNRPEALADRLAENWSALALAPEDEAAQIAELAFGKGLRRGIVVRPDTDWGRRMESALNQSWKGLGGRIVATGALPDDLTPSEVVADTLGSADSEARIKAVEKAFEAPVQAKTRRREDFDVIFLLAPTPASARELRPLLIFHYSGDVPVYAPSTIYGGNNNILNRDLNQVRFVEIPAVLDTTEIDRFTRLRALGVDSISWLNHWEQAQHTEIPIFNGETGLLKRSSNGEITRDLTPVTFVSDKLQVAN